MSELKEEVKTFRLGKHLLGMIKDLKDEIDVDRVRCIDSLVPPAHSTSPPVLDSRQQIVYLCEELTSRDEMTLTVALDGLANILDKAENVDEIDKVATMVDECGGLDRIHQLQHFRSEQLQQKCSRLMATFFPDDDQMEDEPAHITTKADEVMVNRHREKKGHKGKKAPPTAPARKNGPGRGQFDRRKNYFLYLSAPTIVIEDSYNDTLCVARNNFTLNYIKLRL